MTWLLRKYAQWQEVKRRMLNSATSSLAADRALARCCQTALALVIGFQIVQSVLADAVWADVAKLRARPQHYPNLLLVKIRLPARSAWIVPVHGFLSKVASHLAILLLTPVATARSILMAWLLTKFAQ
jgi:hypothetical protein